MVNGTIAEVPSNLMGSITSGGYKCTEATDCTDAVYCIADPVFNGACPPVDWINDVTNPSLNLTNNVNNPYSPCADNNHSAPCFEFHASGLTMCNSNSALCSYNGCTKSLCSLYAPTDIYGEAPSASFSASLTVSTNVTKECFLSSSNDNGDASQLCQVACAFVPNECFSTSVYASTPYGTALGVKGATRSPGRSCDNYQGYCDQNGVCQGVGSDNPFSTLGNFNFAAWVTTYWPVILGTAGGLIVAGVVMHFMYKKRRAQIDAIFTRFSNRMATTMRRRRSKAALDGVAGPTKAEKVKTNKQKFRELKQSLSDVVFILLPSKWCPDQHSMRCPADDGLKRLRKFFPTVQSNVILQEVMASCRTEEQAVIKLLKMGYPLAAI